MAIIEVKRAAERRLTALTPTVATGWEGVSFTPPENAMYQRVQFLVSPPEDPVLGTGFHRELVTMQVFVAGLLNKGSAEVLNRAELIRSHFPKGLTMTEGNVRMHILRTPQVAGVSVAADRVVCPVFIQFVAEVYSN